MNVTVEKVKLVKATETQKPETKAEAPVTETVTPTILEKLETVLGKLVGLEKHQEVPGVPGTKAEEPEKEEPKKDECDGVCPTCGCKKGAKAEEPDGDEEPEKEEKKAEEPAKEEPKDEKKAEEPVEPKKEEKAPEVDLSNDAWRANFYANASIKPSARTGEWMSACEAFTKSVSKE